MKPPSGFKSSANIGKCVTLVLFHCQVYVFDFLSGHLEELGFFSGGRHSGTKMKGKALGVTKIRRKLELWLFSMTIQSNYNHIREAELWR